MNKLLSEEDFIKISKYISDNLGLYFALDRQSDLERGLSYAAQQAGFHDLKPYVDFLLNTPAQKEHVNSIAVYLTIGETYFFREPRIFDILKYTIFKELLQKNQKIRIWSAGCCSGEEPYSIAMAVDEFFPEERKNDVIILGTDVNTEFLKRAAAGIYSEWSFRSVKPDIKRKYFTKTADNKYQIIPRIQKMVSFNYLNLIEDTYPSILNETNAMDIIFCRNVLLYFNKEGIKRVTDNFFNALVEGGWLIPGMSELSHVSNPKLTSIHFNDAILYRKLKELSKQTKEINIPEDNISEVIKNIVQENKTLSGKNNFGKELHKDLRKPLLDKQKNKNNISKGTEKANAGIIYSFLQAQKFYHSGEYRESAEVFEFLFNNKMLLKSEIDQSYVMISKCYANLGNIKKAMLWCRQGLDSNRLNSILYLLLCNLLQEEDNIVEAIDAAQKAIYLDPDYVMAHFTLGSIYRRQNNKKEASRHMNSALTILKRMGDNETVEGSEGLSAGRLKDIISSFLSGNL